MSIFSDLSFSYSSFFRSSFYNGSSFSYSLESLTILLYSFCKSMICFFLKIIYISIKQKNTSNFVYFSVSNNNFYLICSSRSVSFLNSPSSFLISNSLFCISYLLFLYSNRRSSFSFIFYLYYYFISVFFCYNSFFFPSNFSPSFLHLNCSIYDIMLMI